MRWLTPNTRVSENHIYPYNSTIENEGTKEIPNAKNPTIVFGFFPVRSVVRAFSHVHLTKYVRSIRRVVSQNICEPAWHIYKALFWSYNWLRKIKYYCGRFLAILLHYWQLFSLTREIGHLRNVLVSSLFRRRTATFLRSRVSLSTTTKRRRSIRIPLRYWRSQTSCSQ